MSALDSVADRLRKRSHELAGQGGIKLKPELIRKRARGETVKLGTPSGPQLGKRPKAAKTGGPNPYVVVGAALVLGVAVAKWLDWRGHAHPRW
jgi:hypothetical protein